MKRLAVVALLLAVSQGVFATVGLAQMVGPILPQAPRAPVAGCIPGRPCPNVPQFGFRCLTPQFWCALPQPGPIGVACYCNSQVGPVPGFVGQ